MHKKFWLLVLAFIIICITTVVFACEKPYKLTHENGLYIVKVNLSQTKVIPYVSDKLETVDKIALKTGASVAVNTGFFDAKNKKTVSFITNNGEVVANPKLNENLINNENLKPHLDKIFNRGELRIMNCNGEVVADIVNHTEPFNAECKLLSSTQAGPVLLPEMDLEKEFFVLKKDGKIIRDGAGMTRKTDRSMVAIKDNYLYIIITDEENPLTIYQLRDKISKYNFDKALGFDGGGSVSLFVKQKYGYFYQDREEKGASRAIKSALLVY
ncbi:MAG: phosphodiester glycosidase family protein [Candidatus Gastranaerophilales bacterium]|nr:phosphodiester glycosidase family protein [Candidatus Gastranaerophilales bacterium]